MSRLTPTQKKRKKQSQFQKLWSKAERLQQDNERFEQQLEKIIKRIREEIMPAEIQAMRSNTLLLKRLLTLGQRKSLAQWQRAELHLWINELIEPLGETNQLDAELMDEIAYYEAFTRGITLDETSATSPAEQLQHILSEQLRKENSERKKALDQHQQLLDNEIESYLDQELGKAPPRAPAAQEHDNDLFGDELREAMEHEYETYQKKRAAMREDLVAQMREMAMLDEDEESDLFDEFFGFDEDESAEAEDEETTGSDSQAPVLSNTVFKRIFRSTAAKLHPDREVDPALRKEKQHLMAQLLNARKHGDVMTVIKMYQTYVGEEGSFTKKDEQALIAALQYRIQQLENAKDDYCNTSPLHRLAYERFYHRQAKKVDLAIKKELQNISNVGQETVELAQEIKSLKALKPHLEARSERSNSFDPWEILEESMEEFRRYPR